MKGMAWVVAAGTLALAAATALGPTHLPKNETDSRTIEVLREYDVPVTKGRRSVASVPAMISFWGATNQQVILESNFSYSLPPDRVTTVFDAKEGVRRRSYEMVWNSPQADTVKVRQRLVVEIAASRTLYTTAKLPYPKEVLEHFATSLAKDQYINPDHPKVEAVAREILSKAPTAIDAIELAANWVDENIPFKHPCAPDSNGVLADGFGNCAGQGKVACAIFRKLGVPAEPLWCNFLGGGWHMFAEVYLPDAGWVFYDFSGGNHGFNSPEVLLATGGSFRTGEGNEAVWKSGTFWVAKDLAKYESPGRDPAAISPSPKGKTVTGVRIIRQAPPASVKVRHLPLGAVMIDPTIEPGRTDYKPTPPPYAARAQPASSPAAADRAKDP